MELMLYYILVLLACTVAGWVMGKKQAGALGLFERWAQLKDDDQLMLLAIFLVVICLPLAVGVVIFVLVTKSFDAVVIGMVSSLVTSLVSLAGMGMFYFFNQGHAGKKSASALAEIAAQPAPGVDQ